MKQTQLTLEDMFRRCLKTLEYRHLNNENQRYCNLYDPEEVYAKHKCLYLGNNTVFVLEAIEEGVLLTEAYQCCNGRQMED